MPVDVDQEEDLAFDPAVFAELEGWLQPLKRWMSPVSTGLENVPRVGPVILAGNHTIFGLLDIPMLGLEVWEKTGRAVRGLGDHNHFKLPVWRDFLRKIGAVHGTRESCGRLLERGELVLVFPGGGREVLKHKHEEYQLLWKERVGFARLAIEHGAPVVPFASVGVEDMFEIVLDADDLMRSPVGSLVRALGIEEQPWFRHGEIIPPIVKGRGLGPLPRLERQYFSFGAPIDPTPWAGRQEEREACLELRDRVKGAVECQIERLRELQARDPDRHAGPRLWHALTKREP